MIPTSDLRKGNLIRTEYGILSVHAIVFNDVQVKGKDGRILWAKEVEGVGIGDCLEMFGFQKRGIEIQNESMCLQKFKDGICYSAGEGIELSEPIQFAHELQNLFYWINRKELKVEIDE